MIKILIVNTIGLNYEGITSVIYNYINNMNKEGFKFDFISFENMNLTLKKNFEQIGNVLIIPKRKKNTWLYIKALRNILKNRYDVVHVHGNSGTMVIETFLAKVYGVRNVIVHCHNTSCNYPVLNKVFVPFMKITSNYLIGCSDAAGQWLYKKSDYIVLNNAIDIEKFRYNDIIRKKCRKELGIYDEFVIGHVGHFHKQKNHSFLIDIFDKLHKKNHLFKLLLISDGPEQENIKNKVKKLNLENNVIFTGRRSDINELYQAMDIFVMPSLWEGLPLAMLEAQSAGLPLLVSDNITYEAKCREQTEYLPLTAGIECWAEKIIEIKNKAYPRETKAGDEVCQHGFDIKIEADRLRNIYLN